MTDDEAKKIQKRAKYLAVKWGQPDQAEDFAQEIIISKLRWPGQTVEQAFASYLRKEHGDPRTHCGRIRSKSRFRDIRLDAPIDSQDEGGSLRHETVGSPEPDSEPRPASPGCPDTLTGRQKLIYELRFEEEWSIKEIASYMNTTTNAISQYLTPIHKAIKGLGALSELETKLIENPDFLESEVDWIKW